MKLATNEFKRNILAGNKQVGMWLSMASNITADIAATSGYDWVVVDMEHSPNEIGTVLHQIQVFENSGATALVRPMWNDTVVIKRLLDMGAKGLVIPMIQNRQEAEQAVAAVRYPPHGVRGVSLVQRGSAYGRRKDYFDRVEQETCLVLQIETVEAMGNIEEIAAVDGVDALFFGPADISADMGMMGQTTHKDVWAAINEAADKVLALGKPVGTLIGDPNLALEQFGKGFSFISMGTDMVMLARASDKIVKTMRDGLDES